MAVLQMQRIDLCALRKNRKAILETLQKRGVVEISDLSPDDGFFQKDDVASTKSQLEKKAAQAASALEVLDTYAPVKASMLAMFEGRTPLTERDFQNQLKNRDKTQEQIQQLLSLSRKIAENKAEIVRRQSQLDALAPWLPLDVPLGFSGTTSTAAFIGSFMEELSLQQICERIAKALPGLDNINVDIISTTKDQTCVMILTNKKDGQKLEDALRGCGFIRPASPPKQPPKERQSLLASYIAQAQNAIEQSTAEILSLADCRENIKFFMDDCTMRAEKYEAIGLLAHTKHTFLLSGFVPKRYAAALETELSQQFGAAVSLSDPGEDEDVPVALSNNKFSEPVEGVLTSYAMPNRSEIDPTTIMSFFYYFLFGLMLSDAAYGLMIVVGAGLVLVKFKNMEYSMRKTMRMFFFCGISTTIWGILFGSYFGDVFDQVAKTFFNYPAAALPIVPAAWFIPLNEPMRMLVFCMLLGIIHLFAGLAINGYQCIRGKRYYDLLSNVIVWYMLVGGGILYLLSTDMVHSMLQLKMQIPPTVGTICAYVAIAGAIGIILTNATSKNPGVRLAQGLYSLYNVTGYLSDILSYSRLLALGLATGVIGSVVNQMGAMGGGGIIGAILFIVVFLVGHTINFGIEALGAYVHTNRLQYVEFFGKFYEGGAREFTPFAPHTKYFKFKED